MSSSRWERIKELFEAALSYEPQERAAFLAEACEDEPQLREEVETLLSAHDRAGSFLERPAVGTAETPHRQAFSPGERLGRFEIVELLGVGGMGEVYRARDDRLGREVAVKVLPADLAQERKARARFEREARAVAALSHPNIVSLHEFDEEAGVSFVVTELLEGETLRERLAAGGALRWRKAVEIAITVAEGLWAAHEKTIIHRDLKPENLFLTRDGRVKILDFGLARAEAGLSSGGPSKHTTLSEPGILLGTVGYMSPEQVRGLKAGAASDLFSLGCVLYEMVTGRPAFRGQTPADTMSTVLNAEPAEITEPVPPRLVTVIRHCLAKDPAERFASANELIEALKEVVAEAEVGPSPKRAVPGPEERRQVAVVFCDLVDSTALSERLDPEDWRDVVREYQEVARSIVERFEGHVAQYLGDGLLVYFGYPAAHEDDARRAISASLGIVGDVARLSEALSRDKGIQLSVRLGIHAGIVVLSSVGPAEREETLALGEVPNVAARLQGLAEPDTVVVSPTVRRLAEGAFEWRNLGSHTVKGISAPLDVYRVLGAVEKRSRFAAATTQGLTPFVGREQELGLLFERWAQAREGAGQVVLVGAEAGIGKSRLVHELKARIHPDELTAIEFQCSPLFQKSALHPVVERLPSLLGLTPHDPPLRKLDTLEKRLSGYRFRVEEAAPLFASLLSLPADRYPPLNLSPQRQREKIREMLLAWLLEEAERKPLIFTVEDLHWADPTTLEFLGPLTDQSPAAPILAVFTFRPEFDPPWRGRSYVSHVTLGRFGRGHAEAMVKKVAGGKELPGQVLAGIVRKADGVPLFVEELTRMLLESGHLVARDGGYELTEPITQLEIPSTLQASLMARLDRLGEAKEVAQLAAVLGREFGYEVLRAVSLLDEAALKHALSTLVEAELLYQRGLSPAVRYLFKHALVQDAAYQSLLKRRRQELHRKVAEAIEELYADRLTEHQEELAYHYERGEVWDKALEYLGRAGQKLQQAYANQEALAHYNRALVVCERLGAAVDPGMLMTIYGKKGAVHVLLGEFLPSIEAYQRMLGVARQLGDRAKEAEALYGIGLTFLVSHEFEKALEYAEQAKVLASEIGAKSILAASVHRMGQVHVVTGKLDEGGRLWEEALKISREAGDKGVEAEVLSFLGFLNSFYGKYERALQFHEQGATLGRAYNLHVPLVQIFWTRGLALCGKGGYEQALASLQDALKLSERGGNKNHKCRVLNSFGWVYGELYDLERAIQYNKEGAELGYTLGDPESIRNAEINLGDDYMLLSDFERAQQYLEKVYSDSQQRGKWGEEWMKWRYLQHCCHSLGELWLTKGDAERALRFAEECLKLAEPTESRKNIVKGWRLQGQAYCMQGRPAEAEAVLHKALTLAKEIGNPPQLWKTYQALGDVYERQGATNQARSAYASAIEIIDGVASRLQDQELKRVFLSARPVKEIREPLMADKADS